jgi:ectoine hydroxylase-related dioxygenase (phytanoyl-CoA dioxygenase family)
MKSYETRNVSTSQIKEHINDIKYSGYTVVREFLDKDTVEILLALVEKHATNKDDLTNVSSNQALDDYAYHLQFKDEKFIHLFGQSNILKILQPFLNDPYYSKIPADLPNFILAYYNARSSVAPLDLHIDSYVPSVSAFTTSMQISFSLSGQNKDNGATTIVPGSHNLNSFPDRSAKLSGLEVLECEPGDAIIWDSRLWHGALENFSGKKRWSLVATFRPWWAKQNFDPVSGVSELIYSRLSSLEKGLLGFLSLPAIDELDKVALKEGYNDLLGSVNEYKLKRR